MIVAALVMGAASCKDKKKDEDIAEAAFDKGPLLTNLADNIIIPQYNSCKLSLDSLYDAWVVFKQNKNVANLQSLRVQFITTYKSYEMVAAFEFGPAETELVRANFNTFPTDSAQIKSNIAAGTWSLAAASNLDAKGFPALDYLFYGNNLSDNAVVSLFTSADSTVRAQYTEDVLNEMRTKITSVLSQWQISYRSTFVTSLGSDIGSSFGLFINQMVYELELIKNAKIGIPLGKKTLGIPLPDKCEAYYGKFSLQLINTSLKHVENLYMGRTVQGTQPTVGCDDYLNHLDVQHANGPLNIVIQNQFTVCYTKLAALQDPLSGEVTNNQAAVDAAYVEIQKLMVYVKTDMPSAFGIIITYQDTDGD
jgi:uncharacterized protein